MLTGAEKKKRKKLEKWLAKKGLRQPLANAIVPAVVKAAEVHAKDSGEGAGEGKRRPNLKPAPFPAIPGETFVKPEHRLYEDLVKTSYSGFDVEEPSEIPTRVHSDFRAALSSLEAHGSFVIICTLIKRK